MKDTDLLDKNDVMFCESCGKLFTKLEYEEVQSLQPTYCPLCNEGYLLWATDLFNILSMDFRDYMDIGGKRK